MKKAEKKVAQEVMVQEQHIEKTCPYCEKLCKAIATSKLIPKYCYHCGRPIDYFSSKQPSA